MEERVICQLRLSPQGYQITRSAVFSRILIEKKKKVKEKWPPDYWKIKITKWEHPVPLDCINSDFQSHPPIRSPTSYLRPGTRSTLWTLELILDAPRPLHPLALSCLLHHQQQWSKGWNPSAVRKGWESWGCSAWGGEGCRVTLLRPSSTSRGFVRNMGTGFLAGPVPIGQGAMALH